MDTSKNHEKDEEMPNSEELEAFTKSPRFRWALRAVILGGLIMIIGIVVVLGTIISRLGSEGDNTKAKPTLIIDLNSRLPEAVQNVQSVTLTDTGADILVQHSDRLILYTYNSETDTLEKRVEIITQ